MLNVKQLTDLDKSAATGVFEDDSNGTLLSIISISGDEETKPYDIFQEIKTTISSRSFEEGILKVIKRAFLSVREENRQILIAYFLDKNIYILCSNGSGAFVLRGDKLVPIIKTAKSEYLTVSGKARDMDKFFFATHQVLSVLPIDSIQKSLESDDQKMLEPMLETLESDKALLLAKVEYRVKEFSLLNTAPEDDKPEIDLAISPTKRKAVSLIDKILSSLPSKPIRVEENEYAFSHKKKGRSASLAGLVLLVILGISIYFGLQADQEQKNKQKYQPRMEEARHNLQESKELVELSLPRAQELILSAKQIADSLKSEGIEDSELDGLIQEINDNLGPIAGIYDSSADLYLDLSLISNNFNGEKIAFSAGSIRVLDLEDKKLAGVSTENKRTNIISGPDYMPDTLDTVAYDSRSFVLSSDGLREVTDDVNLVIKPDWNPEKVLLKAFAGNMYVMDKSDGNIWRYSGVRGGFLEKSSWLGSGVQLDFSNAVAMAIDGYIWVLYSDGDIESYSQGVPVKFEIDGLRGDLSGSVDLFTTDESDYLYVLDPKNSRVVFVNKASGQYGGEYSSDRITPATQIVASEETSELIFLSDNKLYSVEMKHLK